MKPVRAAARGVAARGFRRFIADAGERSQQLLQRCLRGLPDDFEIDVEVAA